MGKASQTAVESQAYVASRKMLAVPSEPERKLSEEPR
jgi:hypothetical protein